MIKTRNQITSSISKNAENLYFPYIYIYTSAVYKTQKSNAKFVSFQNTKIRREIPKGKVSSFRALKNEKNYAWVVNATGNLMQYNLQSKILK